MIDQFADTVDPAAVHVASPTDFVFLCGGKGGKISEPVPESLRDAFYKISDFKPLRGSDLKRAEDTDAYMVYRASYADLLSFETDLAQLAKLTIIFSESFGSSAELGAFCIIPEIAKRMLVVVRSSHYEESSFVRLGAIEFMKSKYGNDSCFVIDDGDISLAGNAPTAETVGRLGEILEDPVKLRLSMIESPTTFNKEKSGHIIKLVVGLVQEFGALTVEEISALLTVFDLDLDIESVRRCLLCADAAGWVILRRKGFQDFAASRQLARDAANFRFSDSSIERTAMRRRAARRSEIKEKDKVRFRAILDGLGVADA